MSHAATHWLATVAPKDMTHGEFRILFHLCDCHNPSLGCFPKQDYLREHTGLSNGGLNKALGELERKGLIRRDRDRDEKTNRQKPTKYVLGFDLPDDASPGPLSGDGSGSTPDAVPAPLSEGGRLHSGGDLYKDKPVKEPVREPCGLEADPQTNELPNGFVDQFIEAFPRIGSRKKTETELLDAIASGVDPADILHGAKAYAAEQKGNQPRYIAYSENWVSLGRWVQFAKKSGSVDPEAIAQSWAKSIKAGATWVARHVSPEVARDLVARKLVTEAECKAVGIEI